MGVRIFATYLAVSVAGCAIRSDDGGGDDGGGDATGGESVGDEDGTGGAEPCAVQDIESFEDLPVALFTSAGALKTPARLPSGAVVTEPVPNPDDSFGVVWVDCTGSGGFFGFDCRDRELIPDGEAALGAAAFGNDYDRIVFDLPFAAQCATVALATSNSETITVVVTALDENGRSLATRDVVVGGPDTWRYGNPVIHAGSIAKLELRAKTAGSLMVDTVSWRESACCNVFPRCAV